MHLPSILLALLVGAQPQQSTPWKFIAFTVSEKVPGCSNSVNTRAGYVFAQESTDANTLEKSIVDDIRKNFEYRDIRPTRVMRADKPWAFALVMMVRVCTNWATNEKKRVGSYSFYHGPDGDDIERQIRSDMKTYVNLVDFEYVERLNGAEKARELDAQSSRVVLGRKP